MSHLRRSNRLAGEKSPYLLQHARQPVDWYPWGPEAFEKARSRQVPIFLSVGYSTCHWCHVMARESFDDEGVAALLNNDFVCVKVDREERPDVDRVYMTYVQATTGHGGWPMSVWLTPDLDPFYGGTYFPPSGGPGVPGFIDVLQSITRAWNESRQRILEQGARITRELASLVRPTDPGALPPAEADLSEALAALAAAFDPEEGGFGGPPKFPRPVTLNLLSRLAARFAPDSDQRRRAVAMLSQTLRRMASGGIRDHLGGGFHRYAVDGHWQVPHFEKMLYDQAQLVLAYADGFQLTHEPLWAEVVRETIAYVERDLMSPEGACYSAEDADSSLEHGSAEHGEGAFYVWTLSEVVEVVGTEFSPIVEYLYGLDRQGNVPAGLDLHGELAGRNILALRRTLIEAAARFGLGESAVVRLLKDAKARLLAARGKRPRPHRDEKILAGWNGLMLSAWARAAQVLGDPSHTAAAGRCAAFLEENLWEPRGGLRRVYSAGGAGPTRAFAEDYAYLVQGLIDLYETSFEVRWLQWALSLQEEMIAGFWDADGAGFFQARARDEHLIVRLKEDYDGAEPAANSIAALNLLRLAALLDRADFREKAEATLLHFAQAWRETPLALPQMLVAADFAVGPVRQVVIAGDPQKPDTHQLIRTAHGAFLPRRVVALADGGVGQAWLGERVPAIAEMRPLPTGPAAYVCEGYVCQAPTSSPVALRGLLGVIA